MLVPLAASRTSPAQCQDGQTIDLWTNGGFHRVPAPILPYLYSRDPLTAPDAVRHVTETVRPLSTLQPETWHRYEFPTVYGVSDASRGEAPLGMADNHVAFIERVLIDEPGFFLQYPNTRPLRTMWLDIEQLTTGDGFPTEKEPLISIAWAVDDDPAQVVLGDGRSDRDILGKFLDAVRAADPDVLCGYNVEKYDLSMILRRAEANGLDTSPLNRTGRPVRGPDEGRDLHLDGRLVYDVFQSVKMDQTLYGIKDLKLKTVGKWMSFPVIEEDVTDTRELVGTDRLARYNLSDVELTRNLSHVYWKNFVALAEFYGAPLNVVLRATSSFHTTILQGRVFRQADPPIVSDGTNHERYRDLYDQAGGQAFVGGIVEIYQRGRFEPVWKVDFSSMYPSIMVSLGCGADNTRLLRTEPLGPFLVERHGDRRVYHIPDHQRNLNLVIEVDGTSPMALELKRLLRHRLELKQQAKATADPEERERLNARQNVIKVVLNAIYGVNASTYARYGSLPVAVATVGIARRLIRVVEDYLGDAKIETDTDGVYTAKPVDVKGLNALVADFVARELGGDNYTRVDAEEFQAGYFHERKSYLLLHHDGRLEKHGIAFKGSSLCGVFDKTLDRVSQALLSGTEDPREVGRGFLDLERFEPPDFVMRVRLGKELHEYAAANAVGAQVARKVQERHGRTPRRGEQLEYVKTTGGYDLPTAEAFARLDREYYKDLVRTVLDRLSIDWRPNQQMTLSEWF